MDEVIETMRKWSVRFKTPSLFTSMASVMSTSQRALLKLAMVFPS
jgi:hypothetical protein